jgi:putative ABC transport system permease protein
MIRSYLELSLKVLARRKFFTAVSLFAVTFTLLVLVLVAALVDHVTAPLAPEVYQDRTIGIFYAKLRGERHVMSGGPGYALLDTYMRDIPGVETMSIATFPAEVYSYVNGQRLGSWIKRTDDAFWRILQFDFLEGGPFTASDVADGRTVAVINESSRQKFFGGEPALGRTLEADGQRFRVVGVVRDVPIIRIVPFADIWTPHTTAKSDAYRRGLMGNCMGIFLARSTADLPGIQAEVRSRLARVDLAEEGREWRVLDAQAESIVDTAARAIAANGDASVEHPARRLWVGLGVLAVLFMLLPALNLVNLNMSRIMERASEIGVRKAFGASSRALVGQFLVENVVLTGIGALLALALSAWVLSVVNGSDLILYADLRLNVRVFGWGVALALFFGVMSGVYPAWRMSRLHPVQALKGASR